MPPPAVRKSEIMSPAGHWLQLRAAVEAGADSVYFGLRHFTARAKVGFALDEVAGAMRTLHARGVRGYVTFNTLVFEHELEEAAESIAALAAAGVDALILQDYAAVELARRIAPGLELHASTQMSITNAEGVRLALQHGLSRVTLARELSLNEIRQIAENTDCDLEVFVHGALCVAYSGQCFSSEAWGGRSANRGQCAQACRLPYELIVDGKMQPLADARYLLSPGDLFALRQVPELMAMGVAALKIEGRYKDAEYVAAATAAYRRAVDEAWVGSSSTLGHEEILDLEQVYSRGMGPYFLSGTDHQEVVRGRAPRHRGILMGTVVDVAAGEVVIAATEAHKLSPLKPGDGVVFDAASWRSPQEHEEGGRVYEVADSSGGRIVVRFGNRAIDFRRVRKGDLLWRTDNPEIAKRLRRLTEAQTPVTRQPVSVVVSAHEGAPLVMEWQLTEHPQVKATLMSDEPIPAAAHRGVSESDIRAQLDRLGSSPYRLESLTVESSGSPFVPASLLNRLRREAVSRLQALQAEPAALKLTPAAEAVAAVRSLSPGAPACSAEELQLHLLLRTPGQLDAAIELRPASITLDYLDLYGLKPSVERVRQSGISVRVATPRVLKPGEEGILAFLQRLDCELLVRASGILEALRSVPHIAMSGDFSLNIANSVAARVYLDFRLRRITPTHDLNAAQITQLALDVGPEKLEVVAYQHLPVFHTEHCVFCRFLSTGTTYKDCGRPCEKHEVSLRDEQGRTHPLVADVGCRNTVFGAEAQNAARFLSSWLEAGISHFRLEFVHENAEQVRDVTCSFQAALRGEISSSTLAAKLREIAPGGTTDGSLFVPADSLTLPVLQ